MKVAKDRLVQGFVAAMGGDVEAPQRRPNSMARHHEFEARLAFLRYAVAVEQPNAHLVGSLKLRHHAHSIST